METKGPLGWGLHHLSVPILRRQVQGRGAGNGGRRPGAAEEVEHLSLASSNGGELIATSEEEQIYFRFKMLLKTFQVSKFCLKTHWKEAI